MKEFYFPARKDARIHCCQWIPTGKPRGIIQIVHGIAEYAARYDELARVFTEQGFVVVGEDHMGHGKSISKEIPQGCFAEGWLAAVSDTHRLLQMTKEEYPDLPYVIYGHSMGSFMTRTLLYTYPAAGLSAAVLSGTGWMPKAVLHAGRTVCLMEGKRKGINATSPTIDKLMFGSYNQGYENPRTPVDWLTRDAAEVYASPGGKERYWEQVPLVYRKEHYAVEVRPCMEEDIVEIDTFKELKAIDKTYDV